jgi:hypothetical protein
MAYSGQFLKITWGFTVSNSDEIADTSMHLTTAPGWTGAQAALEDLTAADLDDLTIAYRDFMQASQTLAWAGYSNLTSTKVAAIGTNGKYITDPKIDETAIGTIKGTSGGIVPQSTVVLSLRSGFTLGGGNYGRMYLPHCSFAIPNNDPRASAADAAALATAGAGFLNNVSGILNDSIDATVFPAIMSQTTPPTGKGVTQVAVGRVVDTQRRRRNRLSEEYQFHALA